MLSQMQQEYAKRQKQDPKSSPQAEELENREFVSSLTKMADQVKIYHETFYYKEPKFHRYSEKQMIDLIKNRCSRLVERR